MCTGLIIYINSVKEYKILLGPSFTIISGGNKKKTTRKSVAAPSRTVGDVKTGGAKDGNMVMLGAAVSSSGDDNVGGTGGCGGCGG
ncbi:hypothetical protein AgCh_039929 [Apium graveolens]